MTSVLPQSATIINTCLPDGVDFDEIVGVGLEANKFNDFYTGLYVVLVWRFSTLELDFVVVDILIAKIRGNNFYLDFLVSHNWKFHVFGLIRSLLERLAKFEVIAWKINCIIFRWNSTRTNWVFAVTQLRLPTKNHSDF